MTIFGKTNYLTKMKLVGTHIPKELANKLALHCLLNNITRTKIFTDLINEFLNKIPDTKILIKDIKEKIQKDFNEKKIKNKIVFYKKELRANLTKKKIPEDIINEIIESLKVQ